MDGQWHHSSYDWDAAALQARPAKAVATRKTASAPVCQVEGCGLDLGGLRYFFRKQRICEQHARADVVTDSAGRQLRFCQQCTRLEPLCNFSTGRRSCKTSLAKRQARAHRGKAHSSPDSSPERGLPSHDSSNEASQGGASSGKGSSRRSGALSTKRSRGSSPSDVAAAGVSPLVGAALPFTLVSNGSSRLPSPPVSQMAPVHDAGCAAARCSIDRAHQRPPLPPQQAPEEMLWSDDGLCEDDIEQLLAMDPDALADALLVPPTLNTSHAATGAANNGTAPSPKEASLGSNTSHWFPATSAPPAPVHAAAAGGGQMGPLQPPQQQPQLLPQAWGAAPQGVQATPFAAAGPGGVGLMSADAFGLPRVATPPGMMAAGGLPSPAMGPSSGMAALSIATPVSGGLGLTGRWPGAGAAAAAAAAPADPMHPPGCAPAFGMPPPPLLPLAQDWSAQPAAMQVAAMQQQASGVAAAVQHMYPMHVITRFSLKIFGVNPDDLPASLRAELLAALQVSPTVLEGAIRCGCTHLIVDVLLSSDERQRLATAPRLVAAVQHLRSPGSWHVRESAPAMVAQLGQLVALGTAGAGAAGVGSGAAEAPPSLPPLPCIHMGTAQLLPRLLLAGPIATTSSAAAGQFRLAAASAATGGAHSPSMLAAALRCRCHGKHVGLAVSTARPNGGGGGDSQQGTDDDEDDVAAEAEAEGSEDDAAGAPAAPSALLQAAGAAEAGTAAPGQQLAAAAVEPVTVMEAWAPEATKRECWGLYEFEISSGSLLSEPVPVLVLPDAYAEAAAELCQLQQQQLSEQQQQQAAPGTSPAAIVRLVAAVLRYLQQRQAAAASGDPSSAASAACAASYPPSATIRLVAVARHLVTVAVRARWPAVAALLLPAITADGSSGATAAAHMNALSAPAPTMLHLAVASGAARTLAALRAWAASQGADWEAPAGGGADLAGPAGGGADLAGPAGGAAPPAMPPLLVAAAMGSSLTEDMVQQLQEMMGQQRFAAAADAPGPDGWSPRRVAQATDNSALLGALPAQPPPAAAAAAPPAEEMVEELQVEEREQDQQQQQVAEEEEQRQRQRQHKLRVVEDDWASWSALEAAGADSCGKLSGKQQQQLLAARAAGAAASKAGAATSAAMGKGQHEGPVNKAQQQRRAQQQQQQQPSHDATLLASLLQELQVPPETAGSPAAAPGSFNGSGSAPGAGVNAARMRGLSSQLVATSVAGAAAAVLAAIASVAVRMSS